MTSAKSRVATKYRHQDKHDPGTEYASSSKSYGDIYYVDLLSSACSLHALDQIQLL